jgi:chromosome segregation ATPase
MLQETNAQSSLSGLAHLSSGASGSSKDLLDAAEETIEELLHEAQMWEGHACQLKSDLEILQKECDEKSVAQSELLLELSASQAERESLRQEIKEMKLSMEVLMARQTATEISKSGDVIDIKHELKDEVQFLRESNENLTTQLKKTQDANIELVSILQELEETIESQRIEISDFSHMSNMIDHEVSKNAESERKLSLKEDEIVALSEKLNRALNIQNAGGAGSDAIYLELEKENDFLKIKIQELEQDCSELTEENLDLIYKLKEVSGVDGQDICVSDSQEMSDVDDLSDISASRVKLLERKCADLELKMLIIRSESRELEEKLRKSQAELKERTLELSDLRQNLCSSHSTELEGGEIVPAKDYQLKSEELGDTESELNLLKDRVYLREKEIEDLQHSKLEMETFINSHVSTNKVLEQKICELESCKVDLELHISKLENINIQLSDSIFGLEDQLTNLISENETCVLQMDDSRALITALKDKVESQHADIEVKKLERKQKQLEFQKRLSEVQDGSEALKRLNAELQAKVDSLVEECSSLQTLTANLKKQNLELHSCATQLEQELEHSKIKATDFCKTVQFLEAKLSSIQKDISSKEKSFLLELENIFQDSKEHEERINRAHILLNKIEKEKIVEVENLEREVMDLTARGSSTNEGQESATLDTIREASTLRADKVKLEANLEAANEQSRHYESQLEEIRKESKSKIKSLADSLNASKQNEENLKTDFEDMRRLMEASKSSEEALRKTSCELELKFKSCGYEKQQIMDENFVLKFQVQKIADLQVELLKLQSSLDEARFEKGKLEEQLKLVFEEREELKLQKDMSLDIVTHRKDTLNVIDEERQSKKAIQAKDENIEKVSNLEFIFNNKKCNVFKFYVQHEMFMRSERFGLFL